MKDLDRKIAESAYVGFCRSKGQKLGKDVPSWDELGDEIQAAWGGAVEAVGVALYVEAIRRAPEVKKDESR